MKGRARFLCGIGLSVALTGCAGIPGFTASVDAPLGTVVDAVDCQAPNLGGWTLPEEARATDVPPHPDAAAPGRVPPGFEPTAVYRCGFMASFEDEKGTWSAVKVDRLEGDFGPLLAALAEPDEPFNFSQVCTATAEFVPELWLQNEEGRAVRVAWPRDACLKTQPGTAIALAALDLVESTDLPIRLVVSREALDAGCSMTATAPGWRALLTEGLGIDDFPAELLTLDAAARPDAAASLAEADGVTVCLYDVRAADPAPEATKAPSSPDLSRILETLQNGEFAGATTLQPDMAARLLGTVAAADPPAPSCASPVTRFGVLWPSQAGTRIPAEMAVELDGCARLFTPDSAALVAPSEVLVELAAR